MVFEDLGLLFFTALILALFLTPLSISFAQHIGAMDSPGDRSVHVRIMPRMGGLGMAIATVLSLILFIELNNSLLGFLLGVIIIVCTGVLDDLFHISPSQKMFGQLLACGAFLFLSGLSINSFGDVFALGSIDFSGNISLLITLFVMIGIINAFNLSDGLDGLAAGLTMIATIFMATVALMSQNWLALSILATLLGAVFGFLKFNAYPAKLFMGDTGSLTLGFFVASLIVYLIDFEGIIAVQPITLALILALPISDTLLVMTRRILHGKSPVSADRTHFHHRLLDIGFSHSAVVSLIYMLAFSFGFLALALQNKQAWVQLFVGLSLCFIIYSVLTISEHYKLNVAKYAIRQLNGFIKTSRIASLVGKSMPWFRFVIILGLMLPLAFVESAPVTTQNLLLGVLVLFLVAYPWQEHKKRLNIVYALFYLSGFTILYIWNVSSFHDFYLPWYTLGFIITLSFWSILKISFKSHREVFLTSGLEVLLIVISWFIPYTLLPVLGVSDEIMTAAKTSCLEAIPLFIAMKIVIRRQPDRNYLFVMGLLLILVLMLIVL